jgi:hypothetical protein
MTTTEKEEDKGMEVLNHRIPPLSPYLVTEIML